MSGNSETNQAIRAAPWTEVDRLEKTAADLAFAFRIPIVTARALIEEFGEDTNPDQWTDDVKIRRIPGIGRIGAKAIVDCLCRIGLRCKEPLPKKSPEEIQAETARSKIEKTVRQMGGRIVWEKSVSAQVSERQARRRATLTRWRINQAQQEIVDIGLDIQETGKITEEDRELLDRLFARIDALTEKTLDNPSARRHWPRARRP